MSDAQESSRLVCLLWMQCKSNLQDNLLLNFLLSTVRDGQNALSALFPEDLPCLCHDDSPEGGGSSVLRPAACAQQNRQGEQLRCGLSYRDMGLLV